MWKLGNQGVIVLVSVLSGSIILYNIWGSFLGVTISIILVIYAFVLLLANGNFPTPHAYFILEYINQAGYNLYNLLKHISYQTKINIINIVEIIKTFFRDNIVARMDRRRRNTYQLSTDSLVNRNRSEFNIPEGLSPIPKNPRRSYITGSENNLCNPNLHDYESRRSLDKVPTTPLTHWEREQHNGDINGDANQYVWKQSTQLYPNDYESTRDESAHSQGSPWGTCISPKMRARAGGVKTVQTVAGPLLASTRYNIDPK